MKEIPVSNCEKEFTLKAVTERKRLDGRQIYDYRRVKIIFGVDRGCCQVILGNTRVLAQVSCEVTTPKVARPSEGILFVNVELSPMASPQFEVGRPSEESVELNRLLERCLKESRCIDTESLCIMAGIKVWQIRCDLHILNHDGNMLDCASVAAISALAHFRRPDVTVSGEEVTIHSSEDRDPIPLSVHHMPLCVTFAFYHQGKYLLVDPTELEEKVMEGKVVIGMNKHREVCALQMTGSMLLLKEQVLRCSNMAVVKVTEITQIIQEALQNDEKARAAGEIFGFAASIETEKISASKKESQDIFIDGLKEEAENIIDKCQMIEDEEGDEENLPAEDSDIRILGKGTGGIGDGGVNTWDLEQAEEDEIMEELDQEQIEATRLTKQAVHQHDRPDQVLYIDSDSEEEDVVVLNEPDKAPSHKKTTGVVQTIDLTKALKKDNTRKKKHKMMK